MWEEKEIYQLTHAVHEAQGIILNFHEAFATNLFIGMPTGWWLSNNLVQTKLVTYWINSVFGSLKLED